MAKHVPGKPQAGIPSLAELDSASGGAAPAVVKGTVKGFKWLAGRFRGGRPRDVATDVVRNTAQDALIDHFSTSSPSEEA